MVAVFIAACLRALPADEPIHIELKWREVAATDVATLNRLPTRWCAVHQELPSGMTPPPGDRVDVFTVGGKPTTYGVAVFGPNGSSVASVWVDWNLNGRFEESEKALPNRATVYGDDPSVTFDYATPPSGPNGPIHVRFRTRYDMVTFRVEPPATPFYYYGISVQPTGCAEGSVRLGDEVNRFAVIDANCNGVLGDDADRFLRAPGDKDPLTDGEDLGFPALVQSRDGKLWKPSVDKAGKRIDFARDVRSTGRLVVGDIVRKIVLTASGVSVVARPTGGVSALPAAAYKVDWSELSKDGWSVVTQPLGNVTVDVQAGKTVSRKAGLPLDLRLNQAQNELSIDLRDAAGDTVSALTDSQGRRPEPPVLTLKNAQGQVVKAPPFEYG